MNSQTFDGKIDMDALAKMYEPEISLKKEREQSVEGNLDAFASKRKRIESGSLDYRRANTAKTSEGYIVNQKARKRKTTEES